MKVVIAEAKRSTTDHGQSERYGSCIARDPRCRSLTSSCQTSNEEVLAGQINGPSPGYVDLRRIHGEQPGSFLQREE